MGPLLDFERIAVVGATGPTGIHLIRELTARGRAVRAVSRRREHLEQLFGSNGRVEIAAADALDTAEIERAVAGCDLIVDCIGLPAERMADHPATARALAAAASATKARCLQISSYWAFLPHQGEVVDETHPRRGGHPWFQLRREAEDILLGAGAAVAHLPDLFGPHVHTSSVQMALTEAQEGKPVHWMGRGDVEREVSYVPDAMRAVADLSEREEAYGTDWAFPGCGLLSGDRLAEIASHHLGRTVELWPAPAWQLRLLALVVPPLRAARPIIPHYTRPVRYDASKLRGLLGEIPTTPLEEAIPATLRWMTGLD